MINDIKTCQESKRKCKRLKPYYINLNLNDLYIHCQRYHALQSDSFKRGSPVVRTGVVFQQGSAAASSTSIGLAGILQDSSLTRVNAQSSIAEQVYNNDIMSANTIL